MTETTQQSTTYPQPVHAAAAAREEMTRGLIDVADMLRKQARAVESLASHTEANTAVDPSSETYTAGEMVSWLAETLETITDKIELSWFVRKAAEHDDALRRATEANWLIDYVERDYVSALNAVLASASGNENDRQRWRGLAEANANVDRAVRARHSFPEHQVRTDAWRSLNGVYTDAEIRAFRRGYTDEDGRDTRAGVLAAGPDDLSDLAASDG